MSKIEGSNINKISNSLKLCCIFFLAAICLKLSNSFTLWLLTCSGLKECQKNAERN